MSKTTLMDEIERNLKYTELRKLAPNELTARAVLSGPAERIQVLQRFDAELERDDLSIRQRAELVDEKQKLLQVHMNMRRLNR